MNSKKGRRIDVQGEGETGKSRSWPGPCANVAGGRKRVATKDKGSEIYQDV